MQENKFEIYSKGFGFNFMIGGTRTIPKQYESNIFAR